MSATEESSRASKPETFTFGGSWELQSKELQKAYPHLNSADLKLEPGREEELIERLEVKLGKKRDEVIGLIQQSQPRPSADEPELPPSDYIGPSS